MRKQGAVPASPLAGGLCHLLIQKQAAAFVFGPAKLPIAALHINVSCPMVALEHVQPHSAPAQLTSTELIHQFDRPPAVSRFASTTAYHPELGSTMVLKSSLAMPAGAEADVRGWVRLRPSGWPDAVGAAS